MIWHGVFDLNNPSPEPFAVLRVDTEDREGGGCKGVIVSLHYDRTEAQRIADSLNLSDHAAAAQAMQ